MSARGALLQSLGDKTRALYREEQKAQEPLKKYYCFFGRWSLMIYRKFLEDDVKIRAESLAFLMLFSLLPLITGLFYILTLFTQFGMVQEAIASSVDRVLSSLPPDHRTLLLEYILKFKDAYLQSISGKSSTLGVFALLVLVYVGLQTFNNVDKTLNFIWSSESQRPFLETARNFIVTSIVGPFVLVASLSVPIILRKLPQTREFLAAHTGLYSLFNQVVPFVLIIFLFLALYKLGPVRKVRWHSAATGAFVAAIFLQLSNLLIAMFFKYGTNSAYGKAAAIPIIGFWIYLVWVIVILGAEISYLLQNQKFYINEGSYHPSLFEAECLLLILNFFEKARVENKNPVTYEQLFSFTRLDPSRLSRVLGFLVNQSLIAQTVNLKDSSLSEYVINRSLDKVKAGELVKKYLLGNRPQAEKNALSDLFSKSLEHWTHELDQIPLHSS